MAEKKVLKKSEEKEMKKAVGRRKTASARVRISLGTGIVTINGRGLDEYFPVKIRKEKVLSPLVSVGKEKDFDVSVKVCGGGGAGQADAVRHGIARALVNWNAEWRPVLKVEGFLRRDPRAKERKKFGLYKARRGHQWRKR